MWSARSQTTQRSGPLGGLGVVTHICYSVLIVVVGSACPASAANYTWIGGGADAFWDSGSNWLGGVAPNYSLLPTTLQFSGTTRTTSTDRTPSPLVAFIDFTNDNSAGRSGGFTLSGSSVLLDPQSRITTAGLISTGTITDTIALPLLLNGGVTFVLGGSAGAVHNLAVTGGMRGSGTLVASGAFGTLTLSGSNSYTGSTWVRGGKLFVPSGGVLSGSSAIRVGVSPGENATLHVDGGSWSPARRGLRTANPASAPQQ
jgi:autotransporter-associated beta strand protein